ncbi:MAG TPA: alpha/beta fold hydrolase [Gemmataceae bacterium]|nr:alpha/beta fold hydrolase [Gemmataceae bacterium]
MPSLDAPDALVVESVRFPAGRYRLEGELVYPETALPLAAAVLAGPHPLLGGTMHNNVVRGLGDGLARHGLATLRFNYRGVGGSEGPAPDLAAQLAWFWATSRAPEEAGYQADLVAAVAYLRSIIGREVPLALVGYSFGCTLLPAAVPAVVAAPLVLIAPTVGTHDYRAFAAVENPKLVIAPEGDFAADSGRLTEWFAGLPQPKELVRPRLDSHFFRGHEHWLLATVGTFLNGEWR